MGRFAKHEKIANKEQAVKVGDIVRVHHKITEEGKTRTQIFEGTVIAIKKRAENQNFTVKKIVAGGIGVEYIWPFNSPSLEKIEVKKKGEYNRAKLYFLRDKKHKDV